ncbi:methyltransferase family protein [Gemmata sp.]|uniref:methyltransferase family protein n=1 Tax=Gemmata sp. TaxID=1914242 RepID=UPI003F6FC2AB
MWRGTVKVALASALYFAAHSALANDWTKGQAAHLLGQRTADAWYRPFYLVQGLLFLGLLALYIRRQPGRDLYDLGGGWRWATRAGQVVGVLLLAWAALSVGFPHLTGAEQLAAWWHDGEVPRMPDGQEPSPAGDGTMRTTGPLGYTRHPLNWSLLLVFWLHPRMTTRLLAFNLVMTAYLFLGSLHAEAHMLRFYGDAYRGYQERVPFFAPGP